MSCIEYPHSDLKLTDREWKFSGCKTKYDRDVKAAINIKKLSLIDQNLIGI
jgi:transposase